MSETKKRRIIIELTISTPLEEELGKRIVEDARVLFNEAKLKITEEATR